MIPFVNTGKVRASLAFNAANLTPYNGSSVPDIYASATFGWVASPLDERDMAGDFTYIARNGGVGPELVALTDDGTVATSIALTDTPEHLLASAWLREEIHGDTNPLFAASDWGPFKPGAVSVSSAGGIFSFEGISTRALSLNNTTAIPVVGPTAFWNNELNVTADQCRLVDVTKIGPVLVCPGPSSLEPGKQAIYLRPLVNIDVTGLAVDPTVPASEILVDIYPTNTLVPDLSRMTVIGGPDGSIKIYYKVEDETSGFEGTALIVYNILKSDLAQSNGVFQGMPSKLNTSGLSLKAELVIAETSPAPGLQGGSQHPATGEIVLALETPSVGVKLAFSRGTGRSFDSQYLTLDGDNHPQYFGGTWSTFAPSRTFEISSVGWTGNSALAPFKVVGRFTPGAISTTGPSSRNYAINTLFPDPLDEDSLNKPFLLVGQLHVSAAEEGLAGEGAISTVRTNTTFFNPYQSSWEGYRTDINSPNGLLEAISLFKFDGISTDTVTALIGPDATSAFTVPSAGIIQTGRSFYQATSSLAIDNSTGTFDSMNDLSIKLWLYVGTTSPAANTVIISKPRPTGALTPSFRLYLDGATDRLHVEITTSAGYTNDATRVLDRGKWFHIHVTYLSSGELRTYIFGELYKTTALGAGNVLHENNVDVFIGDDGDLAAGSTFMQVDDVVLGEYVDENIAAVNYAYEVSAETSPAFVSHDLNRTDGIFETSIVHSMSQEKTYMVTRREAISIAGFQPAPFSTENQCNVFMDLWERDDVTGEWTWKAPLSFDNTIENVGRVKNSPARGLTSVLLSLNDPSLGTYNSSAYYFHAVDDAGQFQTRIWRYGFDPSDATGTFGKSLVGSLAHANPLDFTPGMSAVYSEVVNSFTFAHVVFVATYNYATSTSSVLHVIPESAFGADVTLAPLNIPVASLVPAVADTVRGEDLAANFAPGLLEFQICGLAARRITSNSGFPTGSYGDIQLIYGLASPGAAGQHYQNTLVATCSVIISEAAGVYSLGSAPIQIDRYGVEYGPQPFQPIRFVETPFEEETLPAPDPHNRSEVFVLGIEHTRNPVGEIPGDSGLKLYKGEQLGTWGLQPIAELGPLTKLSGLQTFGADACMSFTGQDYFGALLEQQDYDWCLTVSAPTPSGAVDSPVVYVTAAERVDAGLFATGGVGGPVLAALHPANGMCVAGVTTYNLNTRNTSQDVLTGPKDIRGNKSQISLSLRYHDGEEVTRGSVLSNRFHMGACVSPTLNIQRFWVTNGTNDVYAAAGGNAFRIGADMGLSGTNASLGAHYGAPTNYIDPVGITDGDNFGRYYYFTDLTGGGLERYDSAFSAEFTGSSSKAWLPSLFTYDRSIWKGSRIIRVQGRDYLYFLYGGESVKRILYVKLPEPGDPAETGSPTLVTLLDEGPISRLYVMENEIGTVTIYIGDRDKADVRRTQVCVHDPESGILTRPLKVLLNGYSPFPYSYAACLSRNEHNLPTSMVLLEPSTREGSGGQFSPDLENAGNDVPRVNPQEDEEGGSTWALVTTVTEGYYVLDQTLISPNDVKPYWGSETYYDGGRSQTRLRPTFLQRSVTNGAPEGDSSTEYVIHTARRDNKGPYTGYQTNMSYLRKLDGAGAVWSSDLDVEYLVPGSAQIQHIGGIVDDGKYYSMIGSIASKLDAWRLDDSVNSTDVGIDRTGGELGTTHDHYHGSKVLNIDPDKNIIISFFKRTEDS